MQCYFCDYRGALKQLSSSAPIMTAQARSPEPPSPKVGKGEKMPPGSSKARQKKFHRLFAQVDDDERVINCKFVKHISQYINEYVSVDTYI